MYKELMQGQPKFRVNPIFNLIAFRSFEKLLVKNLV